MMKPLVSVVISTFNRLDMLERALKSLECQTFRDFEVIVSDDASTLDVKGFIEKYSKESQLVIKYRVNNRNSGACITRNEGIKLATGKYICGLDDDDEFTSDRLEYLLSIYDEKYSFVTSNTKVITKKKEYKMFNNECIVTHKMSLWENVIGTQVLVERTRLLELGGFDVTLSSAQDADMWMRLINSFGPALRGSKVTYILHTEHDKERISTSKNKIEGMKAVLQKNIQCMTQSQINYRELKISYYESGGKFKISMLKKFSIGVIWYSFNKILSRWLNVY